MLFASRPTFHVPTRFQRWLPKQIPPAWPCRLSSAQYSVFMYHPARKRVPGAVEGVVEVASRKGEELEERRRVEESNARKAEGKQKRLLGTVKGLLRYAGREEWEGRWFLSLVQRSGGGMAGVESRKEVVVAAPKGALFAKSRSPPADLSSAQGVWVPGLGSRQLGEAQDHSQNRDSSQDSQWKQQWGFFWISFQFRQPSWEASARYYVWKTIATMIRVSKPAEKYGVYTPITPRACIKANKRTPIPNAPYPVQ